MPTYAYACTACAHRFEAVQSFADAALTECPECGGRLRKEYGSIGVSFSGPGFYRTDSRDDGSRTGGAGTGEANKSGADAAPSPSPATTTTPAPTPAQTPAPAGDTA